MATFEQMQSVLHVSPATLKRDLKAMREELGAPITWDCTERGYRLDGAWSGVAAVVYEQLGQS